MPSLHPKKCLHCKKNFRPKTKASLYCGKPCSNAARASKKLSSRVDGFASTAFGKWLFGAIKQSGTVAVLTDVNIVELYHLWNKCRDYNGYGWSLRPRYKSDERFVFMNEYFRLGACEPVGGGVDWDYLHGAYDYWIVLVKWFDSESEVRTRYFTGEEYVSTLDAGYYHVRVRSSDYDPDSEKFADCHLHIGSVDWPNVIPFGRATDGIFERF